MDTGHAAARGMTCGLAGFLVVLVLVLAAAIAVADPPASSPMVGSPNGSTAIDQYDLDASEDDVPLSGNCSLAESGSEDDVSLLDFVGTAEGALPPTPGWGPGFLFLLIPARVRKDRLLDHRLRRRIVDEVRRNPGIHHRELLRLLSVSNGTLAYHLRLLERAGLLRFSRAHGRKLLWVPEEEVDLEVLLMTERERQLVALLTEVPSARLAELGPRCGLKTSGVGYHVDRLRARGLIEAHREGRALVLSLAVADGGTPKVCTTNHALA